MQKFGERSNGDGAARNGADQKAIEYASGSEIDI